MQGYCIGNWIPPCPPRPLHHLGFSPLLNLNSYQWAGAASLYFYDPTKFLQLSAPFVPQFPHLKDEMVNNHVFVVAQALLTELTQTQSCWLSDLQEDEWAEQPCSLGEVQRSLGLPLSSLPYCCMILNLKPIQILRGKKESWHYWIYLTLFKSSFPNQKAVTMFMVLRNNKDTHSYDKWLTKWSDFSLPYQSMEKFILSCYT